MLGVELDGGQRVYERGIFYSLFQMALQNFDSSSKSTSASNSLISNKERRSALDGSVAHVLKAENPPVRAKYHGVERVYDAFHLLQTESSMQRMVMTLSSDIAVWDAVRNNEVVRELHESFYAVIASGSDFVCGLTTRNSSIVCWGPGWPNPSGLKSREELELPKILPGSCVNSSCGECGIYPQSQRLCFGADNPK
ncbi:hypothetical protein ACFX13_035585 [Malus domestica]